MSATLRRMLRRWQFGFLLTFGAYFAYQMLRDPGPVTAGSAALLAAGFLMNVAVVAANGGYMPAAVPSDEIEPDQQDGYRPIDETTRLRFLADWIGLGDRLVSPGDILLLVGAVGGIAGRIVGLR